MKNIFLVIIFFAAVFFSAAEGIAEDAKKNKEKADMSYAFGMVVAGDVAGTGLEFDYGAFIRGFREVMEKGLTRFSMEDAMDMIQNAYETAQTETGEKNRAEGEAFLAENAGKEGVITNPSGLQYKILEEGSGETPRADDTVQVHYEGSLMDGTVFDSSYERGLSVEIPLNGVIPGWSEGMLTMKEGGRSVFYIPPELAYGSRGAGAIGPNAVLIFEVELLAIIRPDDS